MREKDYKNTKMNSCLNCRKEASIKATAMKAEAAKIVAAKKAVNAPIIATTIKISGALANMIEVLATI